VTPPRTWNLLEIEALHVHYDDLVALRGVSVSVAEGEIVCIIGPNGAGKSTTLAAVAGGVAAVKGSILFDGHDLRGLRPDQIARRGIALVPEGRRIFSTLTVVENLRLGSFMRRNAQEAARDLERVLAYFPRLKDRLAFPAGRLSGGEQQMLAVGRALMTRPRLMLIDEPSLGLAPIIVEQLYSILKDLRTQEGLTLLLNEQSSSRILKHADRIYVLRSGEIKLHGSTAELSDGVAIKQAYFGFASLVEAPGD
jgi:branched-chain amino acid transport system ATP-binding protein